MNIMMSRLYAGVTGNTTKWMSILCFLKPYYIIKIRMMP